MNWLILFFVTLLACVGFFVVSNRTFNMFPLFVSLVSGIISLIAIVIFAAGTISTPQEIHTFLEQKQYIEAHQALDPVENAALTNKKIELNDWLYKAQYSKKRFKNWSFYDDSIFSYEAIK